MSKHGGKREGAGAKARGVSGSRKLLMTAINRGLAIAGREKGLSGDDAQVATESAAQIVADMVRCGRGDEVIKIYVAASPSKADDDSEGGLSSLEQALGQLPGLNRGLKAAPIDEEQPHSLIHQECARDLQSLEGEYTPPDYTGSACLSEGGAPFFAGQFELLSGDSLGVGGARPYQGPRPSSPPHPPSHQPLPLMGLSPENFEKNSENEVALGA